MHIPERYISYVYERRLELLRRILSGKKENVVLEITRALPVVITDGPAGLSGSVKMVGFIPKPEHLKELLQIARDIVKKREIEGILNLYQREKIDFRSLGGLEMAFKHSWENIRASKRATLVFFTPPSESFEVRCDVEIHDGDEICEYLNLLHRIYHEGEENYPAYVFRIREIYDQSASKDGFGRLIYRI